MPATLVVVDMQEYFSTANCEETIYEIIQLIRQARENGDAIIFLEYEWNGGHLGPTHEVLTDLVRGYDRTYTQVKDEDCGAAEVARTIDIHNLPSDVVVCGVNFGACVYATVRGLLIDYSDVVSSIEVVEEACNGGAMYWKEDAKGMTEFGAVMV